MLVGLAVLLAFAAPVNPSRPAVDLRPRPVLNEARGTLHTDNSAEQIELHQAASDDVAQRGKALRAELHRAYQKLVASRKLTQGTDVTEVVLPYVPIGASFSEAEAILRSAGFVVHPHPNLNSPPDLNRSRDWYGVLASITPFDSNFVSTVKLYILLLPKSPGDYTDVSNVSARFYYSTL
jgi:hypothetical protein